MPKSGWTSPHSTAEQTGVKQPTCPFLKQEAVAGAAMPES